jgi:hypothetical protein
MAEESAAARYARDYLAMSGGRKDREIDHQDQERLDRLYVNADTGESAVVVGDNTNEPTVN